MIQFLCYGSQHHPYPLNHSEQLQEQNSLSLSGRTYIIEYSTGLPEDLSDLIESYLRGYSEIRSPIMSKCVTILINRRKKSMRANEITKIVISINNCNLVGSIKLDAIRANKEQDLITNPSYLEEEMHRYGF